MLNLIKPSITTKMTALAWVRSQRGPTGCRWPQWRMSSLPPGALRGAMSPAAWWPPRRLWQAGQRRDVRKALFRAADAWCHRAPALPELDLCPDRGLDAQPLCLLNVSTQQKNTFSNSASECHPHPVTSIWEAFLIRPHITSVISLHATPTKPTAAGINSCKKLIVPDFRLLPEVVQCFHSSIGITPNTRSRPTFPSKPQASVSPPCFCPELSSFWKPFTHSSLLLLSL